MDQLITIEGLTARQRELMDCLWELNTMNEVVEFIDNLDWEDRVDAQGLVWIASQLSLEQDGGLDAFKGAASAAIARAGTHG